MAKSKEVKLVTKPTQTAVDVVLILTKKYHNKFAVVVSNAEQTADDLKAVKSAVARLEKERKALTGPILASKKNIDDRFKEIIIDAFNEQ